MSFQLYICPVKLTIIKIQTKFLTKKIIIMRKIKFKIVKSPRNFYYCLYVKIGFLKKWKQCAIGYYYEEKNVRHFLTDHKKSHNIVITSKVITAHNYYNIESVIDDLINIHKRGFFLQDKKEFTFYPSGVITTGFLI